MYTINVYRSKLHLSRYSKSVLEKRMLVVLLPSQSGLRFFFILLKYVIMMDFKVTLMYPLFICVGLAPVYLTRSAKLKVKRIRFSRKRERGRERERDRERERESASSNIRLHI